MEKRMNQHIRIIPLSVYRILTVLIRVVNVREAQSMCKGRSWS